MEVAAVIVLGVQAARLVWIVVTPLGPVGEPMSAVQARAAPALASFGSLFRGGSTPDGAAVLAQAGDAAGLTLFGVRFSGGAGGSAIIAGADGRQASYAIGDEVAGGGVLRSVGFDYVELDRGGQVTRIVLPPLAGGAAAAPAAASSTPSVNFAPRAVGRPVGATRLLAESGLRARERDGRVEGLEVPAGGGSDTLRQAGLEPGDVLLSVNGQTLTPESAAGLQGSLSGASQAVISVERDGAVRTITVPIRRP